MCGWLRNWWHRWPWGDDDALPTSYACPTVNIDGTPMANCHVDFEGKPFGVTHSALDDPFTGITPASILDDSLWNGTGSGLGSSGDDWHHASWDD